MGRPPFAPMQQLLSDWPYIAVLLQLVFALLASAHVVLSKRDTRGAIGWVGVIWLAPLFGLLLYVWLGSIVSSDGPVPSVQSVPV
jgi:cardiolipin synthase